VVGFHCGVKVISGDGLSVLPLTASTSSASSSTAPTSALPAILVAAAIVVLKGAAATASMAWLLLLLLLRARSVLPSAGPTAMSKIDLRIRVTLKGAGLMAVIQGSAE
jgi:hypothetical protein